MTENEWLQSTNPQAMLRLLDGEVTWRASEIKPTISKPSDRKFHLYACACCWIVSPELGKDAEQCMEWKSGPARDAANWAMACSGDQMKPTQSERADLLRSIVGNPFRPYVIWPGPKTMEAVKKLARPDSRLNHLHREMLTPQVLSLATAAYQNRTGRVCNACPNIPGVQTDGAGGSRRKCDACHGTGRISDGTLDPHRLALVADCLEECGCVDAVLLGALRGQQTCHECKGKGGYWRCPSCHGEWRGDVGPDCFVCGAPKLQRVDCKACGGTGARPSGAAFRGAWFLDVLLSKE